MELTSGARIGVIAGAVGLGLAITAMRFCGTIALPAKPPPPSQSMASSRDIARETSQTEQAWAARFDKDALAYGVEPPTIEAMSRKLVMRADEGKRSLAPGEPAIEAAGLRLTAIASHGTLSLVHFDAHSDTWPDTDEGPQGINHGTMFYYAAKQGLVDPARSVQIGLRTTNDDVMGFQVLDARQVHRSSPEQIAELIRARVGDNPVYLTFDIDCLDPAYAP